MISGEFLGGDSIIIFLCALENDELDTVMHLVDGIDVVVRSEFGYVFLIIHNTLFHPHVK